MSDFGLSGVVGGVKKRVKPTLAEMMDRMNRQGPSFNDTLEQMRGGGPGVNAGLVEEQRAYGERQDAAHAPKPYREREAVGGEFMVKAQAGWGALPTTWKRQFGDVEGYARYLRDRPR